MSAGCRLGIPLEYRRAVPEVLQFLRRSQTVKPRPRNNRVVDKRPFAARRAALSAAQSLLLGQHGGLGCRGWYEAKDRYRCAAERSERIEVSHHRRAGGARKPLYSLRRATIGSTRDARRAGMKQASADTARRIADTAATVGV